MINKVSFSVEKLYDNEWAALTWGVPSLDTAINIAEDKQMKHPKEVYRIVMITEEPVYAI